MSWAFEMETLILGWYILVATGSVEQLVAFGALAWIGSLFSPFFGTLGDRIGVRTLLCATRGAYALLAAVLMALTLAELLAPWHVFVIWGIAGVMRPSDQAMRYLLVGQTVRPEMLMGALGIARTTTDSAKIAGALTGTAGVALIGMGPAYVVVTLIYVASLLLSLGVAGSPPRSARHKAHAPAAKPIAALIEAFRYVWNKPEILGALTLAFVANLLVLPFFLGLLPYVARDVYGVGQAGLGYLAAAYACGSLSGSLAMGAGRLPLPAGRVMLCAGVAWFATILLFGQIQSFGVGLALLYLCGVLQNLCLTPLAALLLRSASDEMRGRVMGIRILAVWGLAAGLLLAGPIIARLGYSATTLIFASLGLTATIVMGYRWRSALWQRSAAANTNL
jgi:predicted MFS family arabinose efflux permease